MNLSPDWISKTNTTQVDNAKEQYLVMPMYNVIVYDNNYSKITENVQQYYRDKPNDTLTDRIIQIQSKNNRQ